MEGQAAGGVAVCDADRAGTDADVECRCNDATEFYGDDAEAYLAEHLQRTTDGTYTCPDTGARWQVDEQTDPAQQRLIRV